MTAGQICLRCDQTIRGEADEVPIDSMSGARPSGWMHKLGDPDCDRGQTGRLRRRP